MANHLTATKLRSNSLMEETTEEEASKTEVADAHSEEIDRTEEDLEAEEALMGPEEISGTDLVAALTVVKRGI